MEREKELHARRFAIITLLWVALVAACLAATGCSNQVARMEENQTRLEALVEANARQLATISSQVHDGQGHLSEGIAKLNVEQQQTQSQVFAIRDEQTQLRQAVADGNQQLAAQLAGLEQNQTLLRDGVMQVAEMAQTTNTSVSAIAREHATLHRMVRQNQTEFADAMTAVARDQARTHAGIDQLQETDRALASAITDVGNRQGATQRLILDNNEHLVGHLTALAGNQGQLSEGLDSLSGLTQNVAANVAIVAQEQTAIHGTLHNQAVALADKLSIVEHNQHDIQLIIDRVANTADRTANGVNALTAGQDALAQQQGTNHAVVSERLTALSQNQENLQAGIGTLATQADRAAAQLASLASGQDAIQQTVTRSSETLTASAEHQTQLQRGLDNLDSKTETLATDVTSVSTGLTTLHQTVTAANESLADQATTLAEDQRTLRTDIGLLNEQTGRLAAGQTALQQSIQSQNEIAHGQMAHLAAGQEAFQGNLDMLTEITGQVALDILALDDKQSSLARSVQTGMADLGEKTHRVASAQETFNEALRTTGETLVADVAALGLTQQQLLSGLDTVATTHADFTAEQASLRQVMETGLAGLAEETAQLADTQWLLRDAFVAHDQVMFRQMGQLAQSQQQIQGELDTVSAANIELATEQASLRHAVETSLADLANDTALLVDTQWSLNDALARHSEKMSDQMRDIAEDQLHLQRGLDTVTATTGQVALDVIAMDEDQAKLEEMVQADREVLVGKLVEIGQSQQQIQGELGTVSAANIELATEQASLRQAVETSLAGLAQEAAYMADAQWSLGRTINSYNDSIARQMGDMVQAQQTIKTDVADLADETALLVDTQWSLNDALARHSEKMSDQMRDIAEDQLYLQRGVDTVTATTSQVALDVIAMDEDQAKLEEMVQGDREVLVGKLVEIAQGQQQWLARLNDTQTDVMETLTASVATLAQQVTDLQGAFRSNLQGVTAQLDGNAQQQVELEQTVNENMQALAAWATELREMQGALEQQMEQIQSSTQSQRREILSALGQLELELRTNMVQTGAERSSSNAAATQEVQLP